LRFLASQGSQNSRQPIGVGRHPPAAGKRPSRADYGPAHRREIKALCKPKSIPLNATGEKIHADGLWCVYEFTWQVDAFLLWERFEGRWLREVNFTTPSDRGFANDEAASELDQIRSAKNEGVSQHATSHHASDDKSRLIASAEKPNEEIPKT
jgi:hypothetical protein